MLLIWTCMLQPLPLEGCAADAVMGTGLDTRVHHVSGSVRTPADLVATSRLTPAVPYITGNGDICAREEAAVSFQLAACVGRHTCKKKPWQLAGGW